MHRLRLDSALSSIYSRCCPGYSAQPGDHVPCWRRKRQLNGSAAFALLPFNRIFSKPRLSLPFSSCLKLCVCFENSFWGLPLSARGLISAFCHFLRGFAPPASSPGAVSCPSLLCVCHFIRKHHHRATVWLLHGWLCTMLKFAVSQLKMNLFLLSLAFGSHLYFSEFVPRGPHVDALLCLKISLFLLQELVWPFRKATTTLDSTWLRKRKFLLYKHGQQVLLIKPGCKVFYNSFFFN